MEFRTTVAIDEPGFRIEPSDELLFVGSCFATNIGRRFGEEQFRAVVNPYGVMYNPASVVHTLRRLSAEGGLQGIGVAFLTLGTNHIYVLNATGEIVDNCEKRPARLFTERVLSVDECTDYLMEAVTLLRQANAEVKIVLTVSPIRYAKYGYHGSALSKATLLLAADAVVRQSEGVTYFPAYEIVNDELRDYRFYAADMLHPSEQAVAYLWERLAETYLSPAARRFVSEWQPIKAALNHRPFDADSEAYQTFLDKVLQQKDDFLRRYAR